jgi:hypothetical protein
MRNCVAIVLIVCGTLLASAPAVSDFLQAREVAQQLSDKAATAQRTFFRQPLEEGYRVGSWILGGAMISLGIIGCRRDHSEVNAQQDLSAGWC